MGGSFGPLIEYFLRYAAIALVCAGACATAVLFVATEPSKRRLAYAISGALLSSLGLVLALVFFGTPLMGVGIVLIVAASLFATRALSRGLLSAVVVLLIDAAIVFVMIRAIDPGQRRDPPTDADLLPCVAPTAQPQPFPDEGIFWRSPLSSSPDGRFLLSTDGVWPALWSVDEDRGRAHLTAPFTRSVRDGGGRCPLHVGFTPDSAHVFARDASSIFLWSTTDGARTDVPFRQPTNRAQTSTTFAVAAGALRVATIDPEDVRRVQVFPPRGGRVDFHEPGGAVQSLVFLRDGRVAACVEHESRRTVVVFDEKGGEKRTPFSGSCGPLVEGIDGVLLVESGICAHTRIVVDEERAEPVKWPPPLTCARPTPDVKRRMLVDRDTKRVRFVDADAPPEPPDCSPRAIPCQ